MRCWATCCATLRRAAVQVLWVGWVGRVGRWGSGSMQLAGKGGPSLYYLGVRVRFRDPNPSCPHLHEGGLCYGGCYTGGCVVWDRQPGLEQFAAALHYLLELRKGCGCH